MYLATSAGSFSLCHGWEQKPCYFILLCLANLSPAWWSKGSSVAWQPAVTFCKKSTAWWPPRTSALLSGQWPHHQPCAISAIQWHRVLLGWFLPQKTFAAPCEEELILTYFHSFLAQTGLIFLHITFCSRKTTTLQKGRRAPGCACTHMHRAGWRAQGFAFWVTSTESSNLCVTISRDWAPEYTSALVYIQSVWLKAPCLSKRIVWLGIWSKTAKQRPFISIKAHHL